MQRYGYFSNRQKKNEENSKISFEIDLNQPKTAALLASHRTLGDLPSDDNSSPIGRQQTSHRPMGACKTTPFNERDVGFPKKNVLST